MEGDALSSPSRLFGAILRSDVRHRFHATAATVFRFAHLPRDGGDKAPPSITIIGPAASAGATGRPKSSAGILPASAVFPDAGWKPELLYRRAQRSRRYRLRRPRQPTFYEIISSIIGRGA